MAQTTGFINATNVKFAAVETGGTIAVINDVKECSVTITTDIRDITNKDDDGWKNILPGLKSASCAMTAFVAYGNDFNFQEFQNAQLNGTEIDIEIRVGASGTGADDGDRVYQMSGFITSVELSSAFEETQEFSVNFDINGAVAFEQQ